MREDDQARQYVIEATAALDRASHQLSTVDLDALDADGWILLAGSLGRNLATYQAAASALGSWGGHKSGEARLLRYLQLRLGEVVDKDELSAVAAIHEWPRRIRELRLQKGYRIDSCVTRDDLRPGEYVLTKLDRDLDLAADWRLAHEVRGRQGSAKARVLAYLQKIFPRSADKERLAYVAKIQEWPRRMRELAEEGWQVVSSVDDADLAPGDYRLAALDQLPPRAREAIKLRYRILERDGYRCHDCGRSPRKGDRVVLQIHHILFVSKGGTNDSTNLVTLCAECHGGRHSSSGNPTGDELLPAGDGAFRD